jgi:hypothetical protein
VADELQSHGQLPVLMPRPLFDNELAGNFAGWRVSTLAAALGQGGVQSNSPEQPYVGPLELPVMAGQIFKTASLSTEQVRALDKAIFGRNFD